MNSKNQENSDGNPKANSTLSQTEEKEYENNREQTARTKDEKGLPKSGEKGKKSEDKIQIDELKQIIEEKEAKLEEQLQAIEDIKEEASQQKKKVDNLQLRNQILQAENKDLKEELQKNESESDRTDEKLRTIQRDAERQILSLSKKNSELQEKISELEHKLEKATKIETVEPDEMKASASNFWINLYQEVGEFRGKIEHPFSKDKKSFVGIDQKTIIDFIKSHTPKIEESANGITPITGISEKEASPGMSVKPKINVASPFVKPYEPIRLHFELDLTEFQHHFQSPLTWNLYVFAKPLQGGKMQQISELHEKTGLSKIIDRQISAAALPPGSYRLESILTSNTTEGNPAPFSSSAKIGLLQVG